MKIQVQAPGKITVVGEYGVLGGGPVLVAAIDLYAKATVQPLEGVEGVTFASASEGIDPFEVPIAGVGELDTQRQLYAATVSSTLGYLKSRGAEVGPVRIDLDTHSLRPDGDTLGLGSTGASAVAIAGALFEVAKVSVEGQARQWDLLTLAAHTQSVVRGPMASGSDVAAAAYGGLVVYRRGGAVSRVELPDGVRWAVVRSAGGVRTGSMLFRAPGDSGGSSRVADALAVVAAAAEKVVDRMDYDSQAFLDAVRAFGRCTEELGDNTGVVTTTPGMRKVIEACDAVNVVAKPTPTEGEGDLGLLLSDDAPALEEALKECDGLGFHRLEVQLDRHGVRSVEI
jgi:mevalonate kinase